MTEPSRAEIDGLPGMTLLEFGASWCSHCQALEPILQAQLQHRPEIRFLWIEDGKGKPLGRSFQVKLWPTLVFLREGQIVKQLTRPSEQELEEAFRFGSAQSV